MTNLEYVNLMSGPCFVIWNEQYSIFGMGETRVEAMQDFLKAAEEKLEYLKSIDETEYTKELFLLRQFLEIS